VYNYSAAGYANTYNVSQSTFIATGTAVASVSTVTSASVQIRTHSRVFAFMSFSTSKLPDIYHCPCTSKL